DGKRFEEKYLRKGFLEKISVIRILDSRRENFKLSKAYEHKVDVINVMGNIWHLQNRYTVKKEVPISQVFNENIGNVALFYSGRFDFVIYERQGKSEIPILAIELDGREHYDDEIVKSRDMKKNEICMRHNMQLIRVENSYARRYNHIKRILIDYFENKK
ncbi:MAG: DUF2726 domain-containing protein, partial [Lachnospiraceae bacterium]|nr:DUF2726 domain-containing protein [Lachnospiraceae bacterium]